MSINNDYSRLSVLGWKPLLLQSLTPGELTQLTNYRIGRVIEVQRGHYLVQTDSRENKAHLPGRLHKQYGDTIDYPTVGDWVLLHDSDPGQKTQIHQRLPRFSELSRNAPGERTRQQLLCANVDTVLIVSSLNQEFNIRRLERYLTLCYDADVTPVIVLTKADLCPHPDQYVQEIKARLQLAAVIAINALQDAARAALAPWLISGDTLVVLGSSGVGKSTLINRLASAALQNTQAIRETDAKGRHTTTRRSLFQLADGVCIIDTPGMRELGLSVDETAVQTSFEEIAVIAASCRFADCSHQHEPGCAVDAALADGRLEADRWHSYQRLLSEQQRQAKLSETVHEKRRREKAFVKMTKQVQRGKSRLREN